MGDLSSHGARGRELRLRLGIALAILVAGVMTADFAVTQGSVPDAPRVTCDPPTAPACNRDRNDPFEKRLERSFELDEEMEPRFWLYALVLIAGVGALAALSLRATPREGRLEVFTDLGVAGVACLVGAAALSWALSSGDGLLSPPADPLFAPSIAMMVGALAGTAYARLAGPARGERAAGPKPSELDRAETASSSPLVSRSGLVLTALTVLLAYIGGNGLPACGEEANGWANALLVLAAVTAVGAAVLGVIALVQRRWISAAICIAVGPAAVFVAFFSSACLS